MIDWVFGLIGTIFYPLFSVIFLFIDGIQNIFYAFAGIGNMSFGADQNIGNAQGVTNGNSGAETDTGIVYYLFNNQIVKNLLISIMFLALFLIIIFTVMAFIKNVYAAKQKGWKEIVGNAIKGLANFIFIPVCCLLGVWLANILLQAINGATSNGGSKYMARKLFIACAYNANFFRNNITMVDQHMVDVVLGDNNDVHQLSQEDKAYVQIQFNLNGRWKGSGVEVERGQTMEYYADKVDQIYSTETVFLGSHVEVGVCYSLWQINYLVLVVGGVFMLYVLCSLAFAMVRRLFILLTLFVISPGVCAMYPIDEGKAVQNWKGEFIKQVLSAYGAIAGVNIFFSLIPLIDNMHIGFGGMEWLTGIALVDDLIQIFILVSGLLVVKELISLISGFVGGEDAYSKGASLMKSSTEAVKTQVSKQAGKFATAFGAASTQEGKGKKFGAFLGSFVKQGLDAAGSVFGISENDIKESYKKGKENVYKRRKETYEQQQTADNINSLNKVLKDLHFIFNKDGTVTDKYGNKQKFEDFANKILSGADEKQRKDWANELARLENSALPNYKKGDHWYSPKASKVYEGEKLLEDFTKHKSRGTHREALKEQGEGLVNLQKQAKAASQSASEYGTKNNSKIQDGQTVLKTASIEELKIDHDAAVKNGETNTDAINNYRNALAAMEYEKRMKDARDFKKEVDAAANTFAATIKSAAENKKGKEKEQYIKISENLSNSISSGNNEQLVKNLQKQ